MEEKELARIEAEEAELARLERELAEVEAEDAAEAAAIAEEERQLLAEEEALRAEEAALAAEEAELDCLEAEESKQTPAQATRRTRFFSDIYTPDHERQHVPAAAAPGPAAMPDPQQRRLPAAMPLPPPSRYPAPRQRAAAVDAVVEEEWEDVLARQQTRCAPSTQLL